MVRRPASVLIAAYAATFAYLLITPVLPDIGGTGDANTLVSDIPTMLLFALCVFVWVPARDEPFPLVFVALGAGLVAGAATEAGSIPLADLSKLMFCAAVGLLLAKIGSEPELLIAVPLVAGGVDVLSVAGGPSQLLAREGSQAGEFLSVYLPAWGGGRAGVLGLADLVFLAFYASGVWRFPLRRRVTTLALALALPATVVLELAVDDAIPVLPVLAAALLVPNLDLLPGLLAREPDG